MTFARLRTLVACKVYGHHWQLAPSLAYIKCRRPLCGFVHHGPYWRTR